MLFLRFEKLLNLSDFQVKERIELNIYFLKFNSRTVFY